MKKIQTFIFLIEKVFFAKNSRIGLNPKLFVTPKMESIDIDNPEDWELTEALLKIRDNKKN